MHATITQLKNSIQRVLKQQYNPARGENGMLDLLIAWAKYKYSYNHDDAALKNILQERAKTDLVHTPKDAPVPGTANAATTMLEKCKQRGTMTAAKRMIRKTDGN